MRAIILAAGTGSRLAPLTESRPKSMVTLKGRRLFDLQVEAFLAAGVKDIRVVTGHKASFFREYDFTTYFNPSYGSTNMLFSLSRALEALDGSDDVIISYGDIVFEVSVLEKLLKCEAEISTCVDLNWLDYWRARMTNPLDDAESLRLSEGNLITEIGKPAQSLDEIQGQYIGLTKFRRDAVGVLAERITKLENLIPAGDTRLVNWYLTDFLQFLIDCGHPIRACTIRNGWAEIDTVQDLKVAEDFVSSRFDQGVGSR